MNIKHLMAASAIALSAGFTPFVQAEYYGLIQATGYWEHGPGLCQPAREYPDLRIRQREIDNIGNTNAYVVCSLRAPVNTTIIGAHIYFTNNRSSGDLTIVCNVQDTWYLSGTKATVRKSLTVPAQQRLPITFFHGGDVGEFYETQLFAASTQCILPPGASIDIVSVQFDYVLDIHY